MTIYSLGDSHSVYGWNDKIKKIHLGPRLCYSFGISEFNYNLLNDIKCNDTLIFCFGEIDCRNHVKNYVNFENTHKKIIINIINNYIIKINEIIDNLSKNNIILKNVCIYNVVPPPREHLVYDVHYKCPFNGSDNERLSYVTCFNKILKDKCEKNNFVFFDVYKCYSDKDGFLNRGMSDGNVHIKHEKYINQFINDKL